MATLTVTDMLQAEGLELLGPSESDGTVDLLTDLAQGHVEQRHAPGQGNRRRRPFEQV